MYIHIYLSLNIYIYIYIYKLPRAAKGPPHRRSFGDASTANLRTKDSGFEGVESGGIRIFRSRRGFNSKG